MENQALLVAALDYVGRGWAVLPLATPTRGHCTCRKPDCSKAGKHPRTRHGVDDATTDETAVRRWWTKWPDANIGIATGSLSGLVVLDVDEKDGRSGSASLANLEQEHSAMPDTLACSTGTGRHLYFRHPGSAIANRVGSIGTGLDVRAEGGYVVSPPSLHANGQRYSWADPHATIADLPPWLLNLLRADPDSTSSTEVIPVGSRNHGLTRLAGRMRAHGMERKNIETELMAANATRLATPLPLADVRGIAASVSRYPAGHLNLPWFQFYPNDWLATNAVRLGRDYQRGWLIQLLAECWRRGGVLPADPDWLWRWAGAESEEVFQQNGDGLLVLHEFELVKLNDGALVLWHPWMADHYQEQAKKYRQKCEASAIAVAKRKSQNSDTTADEGRELVGDGETERSTDRSPN